MSRHPLARLVLTLFLTFALASCSRAPSTSPQLRQAWQPAALERGLGGLDQLLGQSAFTSFELAGGALGGGAAGHAAWLSGRDLRAIAGARSAEDARQAARTITSDFMAMAGARAAEPDWQVIATGLYGRTLVYDSAQGRYVVDPARPGAPENGIRYVLYAVDAVSHAPIPELEIGHADITDDGRDLPNGIALHLRAVAGNLTFLDYAFAIFPSQTSERIQIRGALTDGHEQAEFHIDVSGTSADGFGTLDVDFGLALRQQAFSIAAALRGVSSASDDVGAIEQSVTIGHDVIHVAATSQQGVFNAAIEVNGRLLAHASGDPAHPVIVGADGQPLTVEELAGLGRLLAVVDGVSRLMGDLMQPIAAVLALSHPA